MFNGSKVFAVAIKWTCKDDERITTLTNFITKADSQEEAADKVIGMLTREENFCSDFYVNRPDRDIKVEEIVKELWF